LRLDAIEQIHANSSRREILFDLDIPFNAVAFNKPEKRLLLLGRQRFDLVLNLSGSRSSPRLITPRLGGRHQNIK
jgi:hypothetical protein